MIRKQDECERCGEPLYGDDYGAMGHKCLVPSTDEDAAIKYVEQEYKKDHELVDPMRVRHPELEKAFLAGIEYGERKAWDAARKRHDARDFQDWLNDEYKYATFEDWKKEQKK